jgi:hypothetical protein
MNFSEILEKNIWTKGLYPGEVLLSEQKGGDNPDRYRISSSCFYRLTILIFYKHKEDFMKKTEKEVMFQLTKQSLEDLRKQNLPEKILNALESLKDQIFKEESSFVNALQEKIGEELGQYKEIIVKYAKSSQEQEERPVNPLGTILLMIYFILLSFLLLYSLVKIWPSGEEAIKAGEEAIKATEPIKLTFLYWKCSPPAEEARLLLIVIIAGALGSLIHALRSFFWYAGHLELRLRWFVMYILLPLVGANLAVGFYFVIRGGFFSPGATVEQTSPFGFAALSILVGMFSQQAILKLKDVTETLLSKPMPGADAEPEKTADAKPKQTADAKPEQTEAKTT